MYTKLKVGTKIGWIQTVGKCALQRVPLPLNSVYSLSVVDNENVFSLIFIFLDHEVHVQAISEQKTLCFQYK